MQQDDWISSEDHRIRMNEVESRQKATLPALVNLMQEVAWNNSANLNYSVYDLQNKGLTWVVYRMQIKIDRYPMQNEFVKVASWPSGIDRHCTYRDYRISDSKGIEIVRATSLWLVMDILKRQRVPVPDFISRGLNLNRDVDRLALDNTKLKSIEEKGTPYEVKVRLFDTDNNDHVSNTLYFQWLLESLGKDFISKSSVRFIDVQFKGESNIQDTLQVYHEMELDNWCNLQIFNGATETELIRARMLFKIFN